MKSASVLGLSVAFVISMSLSAVHAKETEEGGCIYGTWVPWEIDSVLVAWAIKRYVDVGSEFIALERGTSIPVEKSIDTPDSYYRRTGMTSAFEGAVHRHGLSSECLDSLVSISRVLELTPWRKSEDENASDFEIQIMPYVPRVPQKGGLEKAFEVIDQYCARIQKADK
jgi:hypothetical protein